MKKKILLIPNMPNWSLDKNARDLIQYNTSDLYFEICHFGDFVRNAEKLYKKFDLLFPMTNRIFEEFIYRGIPVDKAITGIRSYVSWDGGKTLPPGITVKPPRGFIRRMKKALLVNTNCMKLWYIFSHYFPVLHTKYTCDLEMFYPERKENRSRKLRVGWTGSLTNNENAKLQYRGVRDILIPACNAVDGVEFVPLIAEEGLVADDNRMREYYNSLDLYLCASKSESGPRPLLEAAACGVPSLTTDVGIAPELIDHGRNGFIVERTIETFSEKLRFCAENREELRRMGEAARETMERDFNWNDLIHQWIDFLNRALWISRVREG